MTPRLRALAGQEIDAIDTPALVVDLDAANRNLQRMAEFAAKHRLRLRPHAKMHKSAEFARLQLQAGAVGLCAQTVAEAEALAAGGVNDIFISNQVLAVGKLRRVAALAHQLKTRGGQLAIAADSFEGVERLAQAMQLTSAAIDVFIEADIGQGRCGVTTPEAAVQLAQLIARRSGSLRYAGLHAYHGGAQHLRTVAERRQALTEAASRLQRTREALAAADLAPPLVTGAGTGTFSIEAASGLWNEIQPGSFLFMDADYLQNERDPAQPQFEPALFVKTQVISVSEQHAVCDAGHKSHAIDSGLPAVHTLPGQARLAFANGGDEHGVLKPLDYGGALSPLPELGETVWLIPGHCDPTVNLHEVLVAVRGGLAAGRVEAVVTVEARGVW
ncbi:DSD1 family PLP-dependent enzyme [Ottowia testudinis]|uniref:DSD1 family PLP-dependent enzyme n=1 Tax=Ottowia testudinis TaxID=2816950 RepID=A0A975CED1_9BURK|nr:DSD1 family PLP-dependent enzyme [Ottowia testudinis]QTD44855.1 DSD1 family PLP-dependent enzyme [Ottowia testudinis]